MLLVLHAIILSNNFITSIFLSWIIIVLILLFSGMFGYRSRYVTRSEIDAMNRKIVDHMQDGWIVLIDAKKRVVGLYCDGHAVSHARIHIGKDLRSSLMNQDCEVSLCIGDFKKIDVEIPRFSYRVLYEYKVPHETKVIIY